MLVSFNLTQCVNQCQLDYIHDRSTILKLKDSQLSNSILAPLRIWFFHFFNKLDQIAELRELLLLVEKRKLIASV